MPEFRQNYVSKEWVIIASERALRPDEMGARVPPKAEVPMYRKDCPFCPGNEEQTPPAVYSVEEGGQWRLRVVPNKFAALNPDQPVGRQCMGPFLQAGGFGVAEVVIESPHHDQSLSTLPVPDVERVLRAFRSRYLAVASDRRINLITIFRNFGVLAGTSLEHPHSQIIATPIVPPHVRGGWYAAQLQYDAFGSCPYCEMLQGEMEQKHRLVTETEHFVAFCPYASRTPFELRIYPRRHHACFAWVNEREIEDLAYVLRDTLARLRVGVNNPDYNFVIRSAAAGDEDSRYLHWYLVVIPKITTPAGFEIGTGIYINVVPPEFAAEHLRAVAISR